jgi:fructose-bisphosphate aldolase class II
MIPVYCRSGFENGKEARTQKQLLKRIIMALVALKTIVDHAFANRYAAGAFNVINLDFLEAIVTAAEARRSPVILNIAEVHFKYVTIENICPAIRSLAGRSDVPIALNLDHGESFEAVIRAVRNGFTSIMFDGSKLSYDENVRQTAEIVKICHAAGISVEAELGAVGGAEGGALEGSADRKLFTDPAQAGDFVHRTGIDALAVAIGNAHGKYKGTPQLDFNRLDRVRAAAGIPLVLHGGSGIPDYDFRRAIQLGIAKINFYTGMSMAALEATAGAITATGSLYNDYPEVLKKVKESVARVVMAQMDVFGSSAVCRKDNDQCLHCGSCGKESAGRPFNGEQTPAGRRSGLSDEERRFVEEVTRKAIQNLHNRL